MLFNGAVPLIIDNICTYLLDRRYWIEKRKVIEVAESSKSAACLEEKLLTEERNMNQILMFGFAALAILVVKKNV